MNKNILISVVMPVYNTEKYVGEAIESILNQSFKNFEFIIVDDFSSDDSFRICEEYSNKDVRIKLYKNNTNIGVVKTRNKLLDIVSKKSIYVAIMDADDISNNTRLEKELSFLEENLDYGIIGSNIDIINEDGIITSSRIYPNDNIEVEYIILNKSPLAQPSVMIRKKFLDVVGMYNQDFERCQDYELWFRFFDQGYKIGNIQENLLKYRVFSGQGKSKYLKLTLRNTIKIQKKYIFNKKYFSIFNTFYFLLENLLLLLPNIFILWLFKKLEYTNDKI